MFPTSLLVNSQVLACIIKFFIFKEWSGATYSGIWYYCLCVSEQGSKYKEKGMRDGECSLSVNLYLNRALREEFRKAFGYIATCDKETVLGKNRTDQTKVKLVSKNVEYTILCQQTINKSWYSFEIVTVAGRSQISMVILDLHCKFVGILIRIRYNLYRKTHYCLWLFKSNANVIRIIQIELN